MDRPPAEPPPFPPISVARFQGGLSPLDVVRVHTWLEAAPGDALDDVVRDAAALARLEGLEAHARSAERRLSRPPAP